MTYWGFDLGVRSFHAAGLEADGSLITYTHQRMVKGKVADQSPAERSMELFALAHAAQPLTMIGDLAAVEEPPLAGNKNPRTFLKLAQASAAVAVGAYQGGAEVFFVPVDSWKKGTVGRGGADKELVAGWLKRVYPGYFKQCDGDQNFIDATCLALHLRTVVALQAAALGTARPGGMGDPGSLAAG